MSFLRNENCIPTEKVVSRRLALYWPWIYLRSGIERTIFEYVKRSRHDWTIFTNHFDKDATYPEFAELCVVELRRVSVDRHPLPALKAACTILFQKVDLSKFDALFLHSGDFGDLFVVRDRAIPVICYCHSPIRPIYDPVYRKKYLKGAKLKAFSFWPLWLGFRLVGPIAWRRYIRVFCNSRWIEKRILDNGLCEHERLEVLYPGVDAARMRPSEAREPFFLVPGRIMWMKNIELAIKAFRIFRESSPDAEQFQLIVAGMVDYKSRPYLARLQKLSADVPGIRWTINLSDRNLFLLYERCYAVVFTPLAEDWGLVPLEAMAFGKPIISVNNGGPTESVIHGKTGFLLPPDEQVFAKAMLTLVQKPELVEQMGLAGRRRSEMFNWEHFSKRVDEIFSRLPRRQAHDES